MNKFIRHIQDPEIPLRQRLFELLSAIALVEYFIVTIYQIVLGTDFLHIFTMVAGTAAFAVTVTLTFRTGNIRLGSVISGLLYFLIYPLTFFSSGGIHGGAPIVFGFALVYVFLVTEGPERVLSLAVCIAGTAACYIVSYLKPELLSRHTLSEEYVESFLAIMLVTLLVCSLFAFVTGVYKAENRIVQKQKKEIEELNGAQKRFFSSMSHEIRTPVNAIIGLNEMTLRGEISDEVRENSENIEAASRTLLHTVNEILDMSRLESGSMEIVEADYHTAAMLSEIVGMTWLQAHEKGLEFIVKADPGIPSVLKGDEPRIREILLNVIANAVKYTRRGSVTLSVSGHEEGEGSYTAVYDVSDTGIGIREESIPHLFTSFQRVDDQNTHAIEGTGLGLSIVKQLLDLMGGTVTVTSEYGKGSDFHIEIPQKISDGSPIGEIDFRKHISDVNTEDGKAGSIRSTDENRLRALGQKKARKMPDRSFGQRGSLLSTILL